MAYLGDHVCRFAKVATSRNVGLGEEVLNEPHADIIAHLVELLIDLSIVVLVICT